MTIDTINHTLTDRFAAELPDCYERRIIFWFDSEREFEGMLDELDIPDVKILKLTGDNLFEAKMILSETDTQSNYLVYDPLSYPKREDNWLRDIQLYSEEFRADLISMQMDELHIPQTTQLRRAMKHYTKFFESKERTGKLAVLGTKYENAGQLHIDIMAVLCGTKHNTVHGVLRAILCDSLYNEDNECLEQIEKFGSMQALQEMTAKYTGFVGNKFDLNELAVHIFMTAFSAIGEEKVLSGLEQYISPENQTACYAFIDDWNNSDDSEKLFDIAEDISERMKLTERLEKLETVSLLSSDSLPCIDEVIIGRFMQEIAENVIKTEEILKAVESRRTSKWYDRYEHLYNGSYYIAKMQEFHYEHIGGFHFGTYKELWDSYTKNLYVMDSYYRRLHIYFRKSLVSTSGTLDDLFKSAVITAENIYKNWYLAELNSGWCSLIKDYTADGFALENISAQADFYKNTVSPIARDSRVYVIISDALRYDVAAELSEKLVRETNGTAKITAMLSAFPSITKFGMAALLPHEKLSLTKDMKILCDGMPTDGTDNRDKILKKKNPKNCAVTYETLLKLKQTQRRELVSGADVVYIYHNTIDAVGDKSNTENQVFEACTDAIEELKNLVRLVVNSMSGSNIIITSDHGFLYTHEPLAESEKISTSLVSGNIFETGRRYMLADSQSSSDILMKIAMDEYSPDIVGYAPYENIRIKKQGGGSNFVHGGVSLQECCVPVITFKNISKSSKKFVDIKKAQVKLISMTRKISNNIFSLDFMQTEAVSGKTVPAEYEVYLCDKMSTPVSDVQTLIADKTGEPQDRVTKLRFTLKSVEFDGNAAYYLNIVDKETGTVSEHTEFSVKIAFANDFDF
ncbi:BREX-1 system phosphatase PglZ type A [uncultured Ruminococcus sp.]|uniref:BREX-1 system phosphatase PglZ type A n=1 Tax=uncultured Ruminococcus sp. TaxID=165186 RepID=UPI0025F60F56|nr:BREX-1 system phosphatase PglZ type A [uncultured Ruminococcus sp.]